MPVNDPTAPSIVAVGMFDGVHAGHRFLFSQLKEHASRLGLIPVAVTFPSHPLAVINPQKAPALLSSIEEKKALILAEGVTPVVIPFDNGLRMTPAPLFLHNLHTHLHAGAMLLGFNNRFGHDAPKDFLTYAEMAAKEGITLIGATEMPSETGTVSSSAIRACISNGDVARAALMLGRPFSITGTVTHGRQIGRTLGFPTANITPADASLILPAEGVYAAVADISPTRHFPAIVNIGHRPTVDFSGNAPLSIEAHLIGFSGNLYESTVRLRFIRRLRDEQRFPDTASLRNALEADRATALEILERTGFRP